MGWKDEKDDSRPRKRLRKRKRPRTRRRKQQPDAPQRGVDYIEVGSGEFCTVTIPRDGGPTVVHRHETKEAADRQHRKNVAADEPLVGVDEELN